ncbi:GNAT family N-acetyltransferase [Lutibacter sp.]|uniref:GNAT family N-acetyltransferase n=1 Tax=Lutibacter sp. TaxID=1925666 RepID=UPI002735DD30|nr:GNAT family N-acetyltransferase [Lutibacter sp.]MDP3313091.1 GNAT family N-acetyltransferase [Lutibacter sp.]
MQLIFETERLIVRKLKLSDLKGLHEMQSNSNVMRYTTGNIKTLKENEMELLKLIKFYNLPMNNFWVYAIQLKPSTDFIGTVAIIKEENNDAEIGFRLLEKYWNKKFGTEIVNGLINYCKLNDYKTLIANSVFKNLASIKIFENAKFKCVENFISEDLKLPEQKFILEL